MYNMCGKRGARGGSSHAIGVESVSCVVCLTVCARLRCRGVRTVDQWAPWTRGAWCVESRLAPCGLFHLLCSPFVGVACVYVLVPFCTRCSSRALRSKTRGTPTVTARSRKVSVSTLISVMGFALAISLLFCRCTLAELRTPTAPTPISPLRVRQTCFGRLPSACDEAAAW